jgi:hypothetical protein
MSSKLTLPKNHPYTNGRTCTTCGEFKLASEFTLSRDSRSFGGVSMRSKCKPCNEHIKYKSHIKRTYGVTYEQYTLLAEKQEHKCAICGSEESNSVRTSGKLFVDHCHKTGAVRGLLCSKCNHGLGLLDDDIDRLRSAIEYLERNLNV